MVAWFPNGNVDSPSNLTAASGTILGDDTGVVKVSLNLTVATMYAANVQWYVFDSGTDEGLVLGSQNPSASNIFCFGAGKLLVDANDDAHDCTFASSAWNSFGSAPVWDWVSIATTVNAGSTSTPHIRTNYGATDRLFFAPWQPTGWATQPSGGGNEILVNTSTNKAYFVPKQLTGRTVGVGIPLKLRQIAHGPASSAAFAIYNISGPTLAATQFCARTTGDSNAPWFTQFKL
jgi:hypothetical protein